MSHGVPRASASTEPRSEESRQKELKAIEDYQNLVEKVNEKVSHHEYTPETLQLTSQLLKKNPEYYTVWNHRRRILIALFSSPSNNSPEEISQLITSDLRFLLPLLIEFPKCYWIWNYRLWLLEQCQNHLPVPTARKFWEQELGLVSKMLARDGRNFHGWGYRRTVVAGLESLGRSSHNNDDVDEGADGDGDVGGNVPSSSNSLAASELEYTTKMIRTNLSNFSAWHNRSKLLPRVLAEKHATPSQRRKALDDELALIHEALIDPNDQSLWFYHACLMAAFTPTQAAESLAPELTQSQRVEYLEAEVEYVLEMLEDGAEECKWVYLSLIQICLLVREQKDGGEWPNGVSGANLERWMRELKRLDGLRAARWADLERQLMG